MKKALKKITTSILATATMAVSAVSMNASAYGGCQTFYVNGAPVIACIDITKSVGYASTECNSSNCSYVSVELTCFHSSSGYKNDWAYAGNGKVEVYLYPDSGKQFSRGESEHAATVDSHYGSIRKSASAGI